MALTPGSIPPPPAWWEGRRAHRAWREAAAHMAHQQLLTLTVIHGEDVFPNPGPCSCRRCRERREDQRPRPPSRLRRWLGLGRGGS